MITELKRLLPGLSVNEKNGTILISYQHDQELGLRIKKIAGFYSLCVFERSERACVITAVDSNESIVAAVILASKFYWCSPNLKNAFINSWTAKRIYQYVERANEKKAAKVIAAHLSKTFYSIGSEDATRVSLILYDNAADVVFHKKLIADHISKANGYMLTYCYGRILKYISFLHKDLSTKLSCPPDLETVQDLYFEIWGFLPAQSLFNPPEIQT